MKQYTIVPDFRVTIMAEDAVEATARARTLFADAIKNGAVHMVMDDRVEPLKRHLVVMELVVDTESPDEALQVANDLCKDAASVDQATKKVRRLSVAYAADGPLIEEIGEDEG